jgi:hypothetical protein
MLPTIPSLQELRDHLDEESLRSKCETPNDEIFLHFVDGRHLDAQNSYGTLPVDARFWVGYNADVNEFVLNVNFFTHEGVGITREQFAEVLPSPNAATDYTSVETVRWVASESNVYNITYPVDVGISRYFTLKIPTITKVG